MNKVLATDLDGTLFYPKGRKRCIPKKNVKFLQDFIDDGNTGGGSSVNYEQITLNTSSWSSNQQTATVSGMTSTAVVWVNPADDSKTYWTRANIRAVSQISDALTFSCTD